MRGIEYSTEGRLLGHISIGAALVRKKIDGIPGFPPPLAVLVEHLILSHHGSHEFGSPSLPQTREAMALHFLDDFDSKMGAMRATIDLASCARSQSVWTDRNPSLRRALLRPDQYLNGDAAVGSNPASDPKNAGEITARKDDRALFHG